LNPVLIALKRKRCTAAVFRSGRVILSPGRVPYNWGTNKTSDKKTPQWASFYPWEQRGCSKRSRPFFVVRFWKGKGRARFCKNSAVCAEFCQQQLRICIAKV